MKASLDKTVQNESASDFDLVRLSKSKEICDLAPNTIRSFAAQGLRLFRHGKMVFFSKSELRQFITTRGASLNKKPPRSDQGITRRQNEQMNPTKTSRKKQGGNPSGRRYETGIAGCLIENELNGNTPNLSGLLADAPQSFDDQRAGKVAEAIRELRADGRAIHSAALIDRLADLPDAATFLQICQADALPVSVAEFEAETVLGFYRNRRTAHLLNMATSELITATSPQQHATVRRSLISELERLDLKTSNGLPEITDAAAFLAQPLAMPPELIAGILHKGSKLALGGNSKAYKTWLLLNLAVAVATGTDWLGFPTTKGKVLYVNFEIQPQAWQRRIASVTKAQGVELKPGQIQLWNLRGHAADFRELIPKIIARAKTEGFSLVVLDPIYKLYGGTDENSARDIAELLNMVERLTVDTGAAVVYGNHFSKGAQAGKEAQDRISGSGVFARDPDSLVIFTAHETEGAFTVETILRNFAPVAPFVVSWQFPLMVRDEQLDPADLKQVAGRRREHDPVKLLALIANNDAGNPISASEWARLAEMPRKTLTDYLAEMRRKGWIKTIGEGSRAKQAITNEGKTILT